MRTNVRFVTNVAFRVPVSGTFWSMLLILAVILLIIAIAGGAIIHPIIFALAIVALVLFFQSRRIA